MNFNLSLIIALFSLFFDYIQCSLPSVAKKTYLNTDFDFIKRFSNVTSTVTSSMSAEDYNTMKTILGNEKAETLNTFMLFDAMKKGNYLVAQKYLKNPLNMKIINEIKDYIFDKKTSLLMFIETLRMNLKNKVGIDEKTKAKDVLDFNNLVAELILKVYDVNIFNINITTDIESLKKTMADGDKIKAYMTINNGRVCIDDELIVIVRSVTSRSMIEIVKIAVNNYLTTKTMQDLSKLHLFDHARIIAIQKILLEMGLPVLANETIRVRSAGIYGVENQAYRSNFLNLIKLTTNSHDNEVYKKIFDDDDKMTIREAIFSKNDLWLEFKFLENDIGIYQSDWILTAIKHSTHDCLKILLEERVPLPSKTDLEAACMALRNSKSCIALDIIEEYRKFYREDGICKEGPHGCDPVTYAAEEAKKKAPVPKPIPIVAPVPPVIAPVKPVVTPTPVPAKPILTKHPLVDNKTIPDGPNLISECYPLIKLRKKLDVKDLASWPGSQLLA